MYKEKLFLLMMRLKLFMMREVFLLLRIRTIWKIWLKD